MREVAEQHEPEPAPPAAVPAAAGLAEAPVERILALQRTAGNAAVNALLSRRETAPDEAPPAAPKEPHSVGYTALKYACIFVGNDLYGQQARRFAKLAMREHKLIEASSMQDAMTKMLADARARTGGGKAAALISEIVLIAHANKSGFIKMPLVPGRKGTTVEELHQLQSEFRARKHDAFRSARSGLLQFIDDRTDVIVRGCRAGRVQALVDGLTSFFGGQATVYVPTEFQAYTRMKIGGATIKDAIAAYDFLEARGYIPYGLAYTDADKKKWVAKNLPDGYVPEMFFVDDAHEQDFRQGTADDEALNKGAKLYEDAAMHGLGKWAVGRHRRQGADDADLDPLTYAELLEFARDQLAELRRLEAEEPDNWRAIGYQAWMVQRAHKAWLRRPESMQVDTQDLDPVAGLTIPGLSYDTNLIGMQAGRRPDLIVPHSDAFDDDILKPAAVHAEEGEDTIQVAEKPPPKLPPLKGAGAAKDVTLDEDTVTPLPGMPQMDDVSLGLPGAEEAAMGKSVRVPNIKAKLPIWSAPKGAAPDGYFQLKGVEIGLEGYVDWGSKGPQEIAVGRLVSLEKGKAFGSGIKGDCKFKEWQSDSWKFKWKGGFEVVEGSASAKTKYEISTAIEASNGNFVGEVKVFCSYDEEKGELRIGGVKVSPIGVQGEFKLPLTDGTDVTMKGKALLSFDIQPNWAKIAQRLGLRVGGAAAAGAGGGSAIATGLGAVAAAEVAVAGAAVLGIAVTVYASYRGMKDWTDIKKVLPIADQASADMRAGFLSVFGVSQPGGKTDGPMYAKGVEIGAMMSRKMGENMLKGYKAKFGYDYKGSVEDAERVTREEIAAKPELQQHLRSYAYGAFHHWVMAEFYRQWRAEHKGEWTQEKNDKYARTYLGLPLDENPPGQPNWTFQPKPEPRVIEEDF